MGSLFREHVERLEREHRRDSEGLNDRPVRDRARDILASALDLIERNGWCQHEMMRDDGALCVSRAIYIASGGHGPVGDRDGQRYAVRAFCRAAIGSNSPRCNVAEWNDSDDRVKADVVLGLARTIVFLSSLPSSEGGK